MRVGQKYGWKGVGYRPKKGGSRKVGHLVYKGRGGGSRKGGLTLLGGGGRGEKGWGTYGQRGGGEGGYNKTVPVLFQVKNGILYGSLLQCCGAATFMSGSGTGSGSPRFRSRLRLQTKMGGSDSGFRHKNLSFWAVIKLDCNVMFWIIFIFINWTESIPFTRARLFFFLLSRRIQPEPP